MKNLPKKIYLNFGDISEDEFYGDKDNDEISFDECGEVTWSKEDVQGLNVLYYGIDYVIDTLLSVVLPSHVHGGEAEEIVAELLNEIED